MAITTEDIQEWAEWVDVEEALEDVRKASALTERQNAAWRCRDALVALAAEVTRRSEGKGS